MGEISELLRKLFFLHVEISFTENAPTSDWIDKRKKKEIQLIVIFFHISHIFHIQGANHRRATPVYKSTYLHIYEQWKSFGRAETAFVWTSGKGILGDDCKQRAETNKQSNLYIFI